jgi:acetyl-CoA/propionyl-CoA carboxylase biotin carboxyl carrier protein
MSSSASGGDGKISVPMQGTIVKIQANVGDNVQAGDILVVLEAMKMENNIASDVDGTITEITVSEGDSVGAGDVVIIIEQDS